MRLFIAIALTPALKDWVADIQLQLKPYSAKGRFTRTEHLHLTLVFIGEQDSPAAAQAALASVEAVPFSMEFSGLGRFRRPGGDIYWLGVTENSVLNSVWRQLVAALARRGIVGEQRPFRPHLTVARELILNDSFPGASFQQGIVPQTMAVAEISLFRSDRDSGRLRHTEIYRHKLGEGKEL